MKSGMEMTKDILASVMERLKELPERDVLVGIPSDTDPRFEMANITAERKKLKEGGQASTFSAAVKSLAGTGKSHINNAALGYIHEFGAPEANIPARPFLFQGVINVENRIAALFKQAGDYALKGDKEGQERALQAAGLVAQSSIKNVISTSEYPPLEEATLAARRRRGRTGVRPLIDTGQLRNSINYVLRDNSEGAIRGKS